MEPATAAGQREVILRPRKLKTVVYLIVCSAFVAIGIAAQVKHAPMMVRMSGVFFALCFVVFIVQLFPGASYLSVTDEGFVICSLFRKSRRFLWTDVSAFRVGSVPGSRGGMVLFDSGEGFKNRTGRINRVLVGATHGLPDTYGMKAQQLADWLNARRSRAMASG